MSEVPPVVLTTILPFGRSNDGTKYRFSLCIDLRDAYLSTETPNPTLLLEFFQSYGTANPTSIFSTICGGLQQRVGEHILIETEKNTNTTPLAVDSLPFVNQYFPDQKVRSYWAKILPKPFVLSIPEFHNVANSYHSGKINIPSSIREFTSPNIDANRLHRLGVVQLATAESRPVRQVKKEIEIALSELENPIAHVNQNLKGILDFATGTNELQAVKSINMIALPEPPPFKDDMVNRIFDTFSFISSNILLQRFFGLTIDFEVSGPTIDQWLSAQRTNSFVLKVNPKVFENIFKGKIQWQHLSAHMQAVGPKGTPKIVMQRKISDFTDLVARNFDVGGKLKALETVQEKFGDICAQLESATTESERIRLKRELAKLDSGSMTRGLNLYDAGVAKKFQKCLDFEETSPSEKGALNAAITAPAPAPVPAETDPSTVVQIYEEDVTRGFKYASSLGGQVTPLGSRKVSVVDGLNGNAKINIPEAFQIQEFSVSADAAMHALVQQDGVLQHQLIVDSAILTWPGENPGMPSIFANQEDDTDFSSTQDEGSVSTSFQATSDVFNAFFTEKLLQSGVSYTRTGSQQRQQNLPQDTEARKELTIQYELHKSAKLLLGEVHTIEMLPEYKNGGGASFLGLGGEATFSDFDESYKKARTIKFLFRRNESVKPITFSLAEPLLIDKSGTIGGTQVVGQNAAPSREGESLYHLVIRNRSGSDGVVLNTSQTSLRYILPPPISFQHASWHNKIFEMPQDESYDWYLKHQFPKFEGEVDENGHKVTLDEAIAGSTRMRPYFPNKCEINYLPDPLSKGFRLQFFRDKLRTIKASEYAKFEGFEFYFSGDYPSINAWQFLLKDRPESQVGSNLVQVDFRNEIVVLLLSKGEELFVTARTILNESYEKQFETYGNYNSYTKNGNNGLLTPPLEFTLTHATQRPIVVPKIHNVLKNERPFEKQTVSLVITADLEQLGVYEDKAGIARYTNDELPTGNVELYAKWEDHNDNPDHPTSDTWSPDKPVNQVDLVNFDAGNGTPAVLETAVNLANQLPSMEHTLNRVSNSPFDARNYATDLAIDYDIRETKFMEKWYWVKNKSKYSSYFPGIWGAKDDADPTATAPEKRGVFNLLSSKPYPIRILNNKKPRIPELAERNIILVAVTEDEKSADSWVRSASLNRLRFYFKRGRLSSGKNERIGFLVNEPSSQYNDYFATNGLISKTGMDVVSDSEHPYDGLYRSGDVLLNASNFVITDPGPLKASYVGDLESFSPLYVSDLGLMTYLPKFDRRLDLWYVDVEFDINQGSGHQLHCPFMQFGLVHYQEYSIDHSSDGQNEPSLDCRISEVFQTGFAYLMGSRVITLERKNDNDVSVRIGFDQASFANTLGTLNSIADTGVGAGRIQSAVRTRFFAFLQSRESESVKWADVEPSAGSRIPVFAELEELTEFNAVLGHASDRAKKFRVIVLEIEDRIATGDTIPAYSSFAQIENSKDCRIVLVSTFER